MEIPDQTPVDNTNVNISDEMHRDVFDSNLVSQKINRKRIIQLFILLIPILFVAIVSYRYFKATINNKAKLAEIVSGEVITNELTQITNENKVEQPDQATTAANLDYLPKVKFNTDSWVTYDTVKFSFKYPETGIISDIDNGVDIKFNCYSAKLTQVFSTDALRSYIANTNKYLDWQYENYQPQTWEYKDFHPEPFRVDNQETIFVGPSGVGETTTTYFKEENTIYSFQIFPKYGEGSRHPEDIVCEQGNLYLQILSTFKFKQ